MKKRPPLTPTRRPPSSEPDRPTRRALANYQQMVARAERGSRRTALSIRPRSTRAVPFPRTAPVLQEVVRVADAPTAAIPPPPGARTTSDRGPLEMCTGIEQRLLQFLDGRNPVLVTGHDTDTLCRSLVSAGHLVSILEIHLEAPRASATFPAPWVLGDPASIAGSRKSVGRR